MEYLIKGSFARNIENYTEHLRDRESVLLTKNQSGVISNDEIAAGSELCVLFENSVFKGFLHPRMRILYRNPTALCKDIFNRDGETNEWNGPMHVQVFRNNAWVSLNSILKSD